MPPPPSAITIGRAAAPTRPRGTRRMPQRAAASTRSAARAAKATSTASRPSNRNQQQQVDGAAHRRPRQDHLHGAMASAKRQPVNEQHRDGAKQRHDEARGLIGRIQAERRPTKPPSSAPTMPSTIVTMMPPGSRPGINSLAIAPTIKPKTIHPKMPISYLTMRVVSAPTTLRRASDVPTYFGSPALSPRGACSFCASRSSPYGPQARQAALGTSVVGTAVALIERMAPAVEQLGRAGWTGTPPMRSPRLGSRHDGSAARERDAVRCGRPCWRRRCRRRRWRGRRSRSFPAANRCSRRSTSTRNSKWCRRARPTKRSSRKPRPNTTSTPR